VRFAPQHPEEQSPLVAALGKRASALRTRKAECMDKPIRQNLFQAGHARAGVIVILSPICQVLLHSTNLPGPFR
jgi:hypothetical protein